MGTQTLGNPASGNSTQFWFEDTGSGVAVRPNDPINAPEELYIDKIHVFCGAESSNAASSRLAIYQGSGLVAQTANFTLTTGVKWQSASFAAGSFVHRNNGVSIRPAVLESGGGGLRTWGRGDGGTWNYLLGISSFPSTFGGSAQSGLGNFPWYIEYFPAAAITSIPATPQFPGATITVHGKSFTAGVTAVKLNGVACSGVSVTNDTTLTCVLPSNATSGLIEVDTNAGNATSADELLISGGRISRSGTLVNTTSALICRSGVLVPVARIYHAKDSGGGVLILEDVH